VIVSQKIDEFDLSENNKDASNQYIQRIINIYYIYIYLDPRKSGQYIYDQYSFEYESFYVGKGKKNRIINIHDKDGRSEDFKKIHNKIKLSGLEPIKFKLYENLSEEESFEKEVELIDKIGRIDLETGVLVNKSIGGNPKKVNEYKISQKTIDAIHRIRRKNFLNIKNEFEKNNYILLTEEKDYKNSFTILKYINPDGNENFIKYSEFKKHHQ
jgi:hypothetical protein